MRERESTLGGAKVTSKKTNNKKKTRKPNTKFSVDYWTTESNLLRIKGWFRDDALTDEVVATKKMEISLATFYRWLKNSPALRKAVDEGKEPINVKLVDVAFKRAFGFKVNEGRINEKGQKSVVQRYIPPDPSLIRYLLNNRMPDKFRNQQNVEINNSLPPVIIDDVRE